MDIDGGVGCACVRREKPTEAEEGAMVCLENQLVVWVEQMVSPCGCGVVRRSHLGRSDVVRSMILKSIAIYGRVRGRQGCCLGGYCSDLAEGP